MNLNMPPDTYELAAAARHRERVVRRGRTRRTMRRAVVAVLGASVATAVAVPLALPSTPKRAVLRVGDSGPATTTVQTTIRSSVSSTTRAPAPTTTAPAATTTSIPSLASGVFADTFRYHTDTITINDAGVGTATWIGYPVQVTEQASFHLTTVSGRTATGVVDTTTDPNRWLASGQMFELTLQSNDMLDVVPGGPFVPLCGSAAFQQNHLHCGA